MLEVTELTKYYGDLLAVNELSFRIEHGEFGTLLGPSGSGKSTTLHMIAGMIEPTSGEIRLRDEDVTDVPPDERNIGMVFQQTSLFPHMTVRENIAYGLEMHGVDDDEIDGTVHEFLELVQMSGYEDQHPSELSGGQQRRISLARALAYEPDILLLDEPLTGLDRVLREEMREEIKRIQRDIDVTTLLVTHDQEEALSMSDRIVTLDNGKKMQEGTPRELYESPANEFVAEFVGKSTKFTGRVSDDPALVDVGEATIRIDGSASLSAGTEVSVYVRPEDLDLVTGDDAVENAFRATVTRVANVGNHSEVELQLEDGTPLLAEVDRFPDIHSGDDVTVGFRAEDVIVIES